MFKQTSVYELTKIENEKRTYSCPQCGGAMKDMGHDFKAPKQQDKRQWMKVERLYENGFAYHSCGCDGPGYRPAKLTEVESFLRDSRKPSTLGEAYLKAWIAEGQSETR